MKRFVMLVAAMLALFAFTGVSAYADHHMVTVTITEQNGSGQNGTATLMDMGDGTTKVTVNVSGGSSTAQPAHIHAGSCANLNPKPAWPLTSVVNGMSETMVPASLSEIATGGFAINVHKSAAEASVYVACGDIAALTTAGMPRTGGMSLTTLAASLAALALIAMAFGWRLARRRA